MYSHKKHTDFLINPREVLGDIDYEIACKRLGVKKISKGIKRELCPDNNKMNFLLRRDIIFAHNNLNEIIDSQKQGTGFFIVTGRGPSNRMHMGHLIPFMFSKWLQDRFGVNVYIQIADDEKFLNTKHSIDKIDEYANKNLLDIIALGFDKNKTFAFKHTEYIKNMYPLILRINKCLKNFNSYKDMLGLEDEWNPGLCFYPSVQIAGTALESKQALAVVGLDQAPYYTIQNKIYDKLNIAKAGGIYNRLLPSLDPRNSKMNASMPEGTIYLSDNPEDVETKIRRFFKTKDSLQKNKLSRMLYYILEENDKSLKELKSAYLEKVWDSSNLEDIVIDSIIRFLSIHENKKDHAADNLIEYTEEGKLASVMRQKYYK